MAFRSQLALTTLVRHHHHGDLEAKMVTTRVARTRLGREVNGARAVGPTTQGESGRRGEWEAGRVERAEMVGGGDGGRRGEWEVSKGMVGGWNGGRRGPGRRVEATRGRLRGLDSCGDCGDCDSGWGCCSNGKYILVWAESRCREVERKPIHPRHRVSEPVPTCGHASFAGHAGRVIYQPRNRQKRPAGWCARRRARGGMGLQQGLHQGLQRGLQQGLQQGQGQGQG